MSLAPLLRKIFLIDLLKGLRVTFKYQHPKEIYTEQYPLERPVIAERYRGLPRLNVNPDTGETLCIACDLCAKACPEQLIKLESERDPVTKRKVLTTYTFDLSRCMFCGLCEESCSTDALELSQDYEIALYDRKNLVLDRKRLESGPEPTEYTR
jgi:NADH-quinone oxidoreductase subunit I